MFSRVSKSVSRLLALACVVSIPLALGAQTSAKPAAKAAVGDTASKWDIFAGYSFLDPNSHVDGTTTLGKKDPVDFKTEKIGTVESVTRYFNDHWGLQIDSGQHDLFVDCTQPCISNSAILTMQAGAVYRWAEKATRSRRGSMPWEAEDRWKVRTTRITRRGTRSLWAAAWTARSRLIGPSGARATMSSCTSISERRITPRS